MPLGEGDALGGYRIVRLIGRGGMGAVYLADDVRLGRKVALKVLGADTAALPRVRERFVRESHLAASLDHPHILPIYEAGDAAGEPFIAMRYVPGPDLAGIIERDGPLPLDRTVALIAQVASALDAAHAAGLIHRDVKPGNILVAPGSAPGTDHAYLSDFGLTKHAEYSEALTRSGQLMGSVGYVAPEQIENRPIDARADVYSLGCVLYECLAGSQPYPRETEMATLYAHVHAPPPSLAAARPELPAAIDAVIARALAKDPAARFPSTGDLAEALAAAAAPEAAARHLTRGFLFADLRGYTAYVETRGDAAGAALLDAYRRLVRDVVRRFGGAEIRTEGDSFYVVFPSASDAVRCGLALVAAAASATAEHPERPIRVGVGVHAGETADTAEGYVGSAVNLAARLCAAAGAGEVLVSDTVRGLTRTSGEAAFAARGRKQFKGIVEPIAVYAATTVEADGARAAVPPSRRPPVASRLVGFGDPRRVVVAAAAGATGVALAVVLVVGALGGAFGPSRSLAPAATASPTPGAVAASGPTPSSGPPGGSPSPGATTYAFGFAGSADGVIGHDAGGNVELAAGRYVEADYGLPHISMTLGTGWSLVDRAGESIGLIRTTEPDDFLGFGWPTQVPTDACAKASRPLSASGNDFAVWLAQTPALSVTPPLNRYFGAFAAQQSDFTVVVKATCATTNPPAFRITPPVNIGGGNSNDQGEFWPAGLRYRVAYGVFEGHLLRILIQAPEDTAFQAFDPLVEAVLATIGSGSAATATEAP
ncbi:MAG TPA: protein kinase [Candidatus Sulfotelmatobacter sp.]|nr:protein kinase [Candidatus Sulfotelmatobacter sp.]